jgi:hypothetical protein
MAADLVGRRVAVIVTLERPARPPKPPPSRQVRRREQRDRWRRTLSG